jgi:hypothetical protein
MSEMSRIQWKTFKSKRSSFNLLCIGWYCRGLFTRTKTTTPSALLVLSLLRTLVSCIRHGTSESSLAIRHTGRHLPTAEELDPLLVVFVATGSLVSLSLSPCMRTTARKPAESPAARSFSMSEEVPSDVAFSSRGVSRTSSEYRNGASRATSGLGISSADRQDTR